MGTLPAANLFCLRGSAAVPCVFFFGRLYGVRFFFGPIIWHALMTPKSCWRRRCWAQSPGSVTAVGRRRRHGESPPGGKATTGTSRLAAGSPLCVVAGRRNRRGAASPGGRAAAGQSSRAVELPSGGAAAGRCVGRAPSGRRAGAERAPSGRRSRRAAEPPPDGVAVRQGGARCHRRSGPFGIRGSRSVKPSAWRSIPCAGFPRRVCGSKYRMSLGSTRCRSPRLRRTRGSTGSPLRDAAFR